MIRRPWPALTRQGVLLARTARPTEGTRRAAGAHRVCVCLARFTSAEPRWERKAYLRAGGAGGGGRRCRRTRLSSQQGFISLSISSLYTAALFLSSTTAALAFSHSSPLRRFWSVRHHFSVLRPTYRSHIKTHTSDGRWTLNLNDDEQTCAI